ncbi:putative eka-like protein [Erysiphe necator]|uniref:Putative eka-like protein n=1 Tax=Uncinula necator TaxID=52586 RepID=A0A0B1PIV7_UNCNE|nr:putative eka-like protein [Erysiphe necator]
MSPSPTSLSPIPLDALSPTPNTPPPLTPSQNTSLPNIPIVNRKFLESVPLSKPAAQDAADPDSSCQLNEEDLTLRYLPPELAKIFAARQQQKRAWHIRLMACSSFISNIDSTVNNFQEGEEKETARKIQSQLLAAISQFLAADVYPASPSFRNPSKLKHSIEELKALIQKKTFQVAAPLVTPTAKPTLKKLPAP